MSSRRIRSYRIQPGDIVCLSLKNDSNRVRLPTWKKYDNAPGMGQGFSDFAGYVAEDKIALVLSRVDDNAVFVLSDVGLGYVEQGFIETVSEHGDSC